MVAEDGFDTVAAISALESTLPSAWESTLTLFSGISGTFQLASMSLQLVPAMAGIAGVLGGISSGFDKAGKVLDGIDKIWVTCDKVMEIYNQHPDPAAHPQVAGALLRKAFTLMESGRPAEALSVYDDLVRRFGSDTDASVIRSVRWARIDATKMLNKLQKFEEALTRCGEIVERYGTDPDPAVVADLLNARLNRLEAFAGLQRTDEAVSCFDEIASICDGFEDGGAESLEIRVRQDHMNALAMKSWILLQQGRLDEALAASDEGIERFRADQLPAVRSGAAWCLLAKAVALHAQKRWKEAIDAYNEILATYSRDRSLRNIALNAGYAKIGLFLQLGRFEDAVHACEDVRQEFRNDRAVQVITTALKVDGYRGLSQHKKAVKACGKLVDLIGADPDVWSRRLVAHVLRLKALSLWALSRREEALSVCKEIDRRFGEDPRLILRQEVAQALSYQSVALGLCERWDEAAAVMYTIVARYGEDADPVLKEMSDRARSRLVDLGQIGARAEDHPSPAGGG